MHVVQFIHRYPPAVGGSESYTARLARDLAAHHHRSEVWTTTALHLGGFQSRGYPESPPGEAVEDGVTVRRFPLSYRWPGRRVLLKAASLVPVRSWQARVAPWMPMSRPMWRAAGADTARPDVVHALAFPFGSIASCALRLARRAGARFVVTPFLHLGDPDDPNDPIRRAYTSAPMRWLLRQADRVLVQTPTEKAHAAAMGVDAERIVIQGMGVDPAECTGGDRETARRVWGVRPGEVVIGHLANLSPEKGSIDLMRAFEQVRGRRTGVQLVLAGSAMPAFEDYWNNSGAAPAAIRLGPLNDPGKRDFFAGIDVFAMPSRSDSFGIVFLEAWANGVPVIGYRSGGVADLIRHEGDGLLVRCGDIDGLARAIERLCDRPDERATWGAVGRSRVRTEFRWEDKLSVARSALTTWD
jgi:glycosyltransferase involved in cell wall biosynthesis